MSRQLDRIAFYDPSWEGGRWRFICTAQHMMPVGMSDELWLDSLAMRIVPPGLEWHLVPFEEFPVDRTFRNAWELSGDLVDAEGKSRNVVVKDLDGKERVVRRRGVQVNIEGARKIRAEALHRLRKAAIDETQGDIEAAVDAGDMSREKQLRKDRKALREVDIQAQLAQLGTTQEIKDFIPAGLVLHWIEREHGRRHEFVTLDSDDARSTIAAFRHNASKCLAATNVQELLPHVPAVPPRRKQGDGRMGIRGS